MKRRVIDQRNKEKFQMDDAYFNGMARRCGINATGVYAVLCRHSNKDQEAFPSKKLISDETGHTDEELHDYFKQKFLSPEWREVMGKEIQMYPSTTKLSKQDFRDYMERISAETGVPLPDPEHVKAI